MAKRHFAWFRLQGRNRRAPAGRRSSPADCSIADSRSPFRRATLLLETHADPLPIEGGRPIRASTGSGGRLFAGIFRGGGRDRVPRARPRLCRETSRVPASARQSPNVPVSYPRRVRFAPSQATQHAHVQVFLRSPLTDSNRRPPPYHGGSGAVLAGTAGHSRSRFSCKSALILVPALPARARACPVCCTRLVPATRCLFVKRATRAGQTACAP